MPLKLRRGDERHRPETGRFHGRFIPRPLQVGLRLIKALFLFAASDINHALLQSHTIALLERGLESGNAP